jgi:hypothetical protein
MDSKVILVQNGKFVTKITTSNGVIGFVAFDVDEKALEGLLNKLLARKVELDLAHSPP